MPGVPSKLSRALGNVQAELRSGKTRGSNPRALTAEEIGAKTALRDDLQKQIRQKARERTINRINAHTSSQADRVIEANARQINEATAESREFFASVSGAGSSTDLRAQAAVLRAKATEKAKEERKAQRAAERAAAKGQRPEAPHAPPSQSEPNGAAAEAETIKPIKPASPGDLCTELVLQPVQEAAPSDTKKRGADGDLEGSNRPAPAALVSEINNGLRPAFMSPPAADKLLEFCKRRLADATRIHTDEGL